MEAEPLGPGRGLVSPPGAGMGFPIVRGDVRRREPVKVTEEVPSVGGALLYYVVRPPVTRESWDALEP